MTTPHTYCRTWRKRADECTCLRCTPVKEPG